MRTTNAIVKNRKQCASIQCAVSEHWRRRRWRRWRDGGWGWQTNAKKCMLSVLCKSPPPAATSLNVKHFPSDCASVLYCVRVDSEFKYISSSIWSSVSLSLASTESLDTHIQSNTLAFLLPNCFFNDWYAHSTFFNLSSHTGSYEEREPTTSIHTSAWVWLLFVDWLTSEMMKTWLKWDLRPPSKTHV